MTKRDILTAIYGLLATFAIALVFGYFFGVLGFMFCLLCSVAGLAELGDDKAK